MAKFDIRSFYLSYIDALNSRAFDELDSFVADEIAFGTQVYPRDAVAGSLAGIIEAVPDFRWAVQEILIDGDRLAVRLLNSGTPVKEWNGITPTGASFQIAEHAMYRVADGRFTEMMNLHDYADLARQLRTSRVEPDAEFPRRA
ncbi:ester cyclase [Microbacterium sp. E-13]|uniref:ester cyclase n=1 Tax=Microbacterium sp. E-13 TaxID=3404048 RepID=UPI003CF56654